MKAEDIAGLVPGCKLYIQPRNPALSSVTVSLVSAKLCDNSMQAELATVATTGLMLCYVDEIYEQGHTATCNHCCEAIVLDKYANWRRQDGESDLCADSNDSIAADQTHVPWCKPPASFDTIADDLTGLLSDILSDEQEDYDNMCLENHPEHCEKHIYRVAERLQHFEELLREAPNMFVLIVRLMRKAGEKDDQIGTELADDLIAMLKKLSHQWPTLDLPIEETGAPP